MRHVVELSMNKIITSHEAALKACVCTTFCVIYLWIKYISLFLTCSESVQATWALSFDQEVQARVAEDAELGVVDFIEDTRHSQKESKRVRAACSG
ncbi:MAG: hypothetical protein OEY28_09130, partial [Nitrospira sp.]|nr:hypothetical protein [Nitrospira sp.]